MVDTGEVVAVKKVLQDKRFKNRELQVEDTNMLMYMYMCKPVLHLCIEAYDKIVQIMKQLRHVNIVELKNCFYTNGEKPEEVYLNLLLEFVPETVYRIIRHYRCNYHPVI